VCGLGPRVNISHEQEDAMLDLHDAKGMPLAAIPSSPQSSTDPSPSSVPLAP
jgi:hypothetical protein